MQKTVTYDEIEFNPERNDLSANLVIVRHGETVCNREDKLYGSYDSQLTKTGRIQAEGAGVKLEDADFDICICSPLVRAKDTAEIIAKKHPGLKIITDSRIMERSVGRNRENTPMGPNNNWNSDGVESMKSLHKRVDEFYDDICQKYKGKKILIVAHFWVIKAMYEKATNSTDVYMSLPNAACVAIPLKHA